MTHRIWLILIASTSLSLSACGQNAQDMHDINMALSAAPDELRDGATVYAYNEDGTFRTVREGSNELVCSTDNPSDDRFETVCFHESLEPYVRRGRELNAEGITGPDNIERRAEEVEAGTLPWPSTQATMYIRYGDEAHYDEASGEVVDSQIRYVIYAPYATGATTGLSESAIPGGGPWLMSAGTFRAHIMIIPD